MLNLKSFLAVDFGAGSVKLAAFEVNEAGGLRLVQYGIESLGADGAQDTTRAAVTQKALQKLLAEKGVKSKSVNACAPGFQVFSKFVKLPPVEPGKVEQIIQYEAQQNVPFPLAEVVWDYQILGTLPSGELEVLLVAIKSDVVEGLFNIAEQSKLKLQVADASVAALCNAFKFNYSDLEDCTMLLDIGAKTSNLLFFEKGKIFSRSINIGANSITQDFCNESKLPFADAEKIKIAEGFVSLGGAYEEPENPNQAAISKIARQFMTRLHIQVNQTLQVYRSQQGGSAPVRLFLSGGASIMPYTAQFFAEKLNLPVEYFNPLRNVEIDPALNLEELARSAHSLGEVVGLGLRNLAHCPVELNLMPESTISRQSFNQKKPYLIATIFLLAVVVFAAGWLFEKLAAAKQTALDDITTKMEPIRSKVDKFQKAYKELQSTKKQGDQISTWIADRYFWPDLFTEIRTCAINAEKKAKAKLNNNDTGIWVDSVSMPGAVAGAAPVAMHRGGEDEGAAPPPVAAAPADGSNANQNQVDTLVLNCRAVSLTTVSASANTDIAFALLTELKASPLFVPEQTQFFGNISQDEAPGTFTFAVTVKIKSPLKF
ncbi:MAG: hypothetical protein RLZZ350_2190 [Verrucomicrobiota bacterium]|jgi:type IV pilus assembly protein PilM